MYASYCATKDAYFGFLTSIIAEENKRFCLDINQNFIQKPAESAMEDLHTQYGQFYAELTSFVNELVNKLTPDAPPELQYLTILPDILPMDDPDFQYGNEDGVVNRAVIVTKFTKLVLARMRQFVEEDGQGWFDEQAEMLQIWLGLVEVNLVNLRIDDEQSSQYMEIGIGGINPGVDTYREVNVENLVALRDTLLASGGQESE